jgi:enoyl-[acyl-carrier protein] reductase II
VKCDFHFDNRIQLMLICCVHLFRKGGVGILATGPLTADETRHAIRTIRSQTDQPFGIGATLLMPGSKENVEVAIAEQVPIVNISLGKGNWIADRVHEYSGKILATVTNSKHAQSAIDYGADALMLTGHEAAAHGGDVTSLVLTPSIARRYPDVPIVAAGGYADGRGLAAAIALGADAVAMGSRFAITQESPLAQQMKEIVSSPNSTESDTLYGKNFDGIPARVLKNDEAIRLMKNPASLPVVVYRALVAARKMDIPLYKVIPGLLTQWEKMYIIAQFGAATDSLMKATVEGNYKDGVQFIGQSQGLIEDIPTVHELVQRVMHEAMDASSRCSATFL